MCGSPPEGAAPAQVLNRCLTLGVQLFVPMAVLGCAVRAPPQPA